MSGFYTDLAMESGKIGAGGQTPGVNVTRDDAQGVTRVRVDVIDEDGARATGKPTGAYTTLYADDLNGGDEKIYGALRAMLAREISGMSALSDDVAQGSVLVLGLGNRFVTPDALGPRAADQVLGTRALLDAANIGGLRRVMTAAPGVYGATGIEVSETVKGLAREIAPTLIIALDALCARDPSRIATTVQLSDSGIQPGSGVGNHRAELSQRSLGVKVLAIGVPTVVYASTIVSDALARSNAQISTADSENLQNSVGDMIVTPREIDSLVARAARLIAEAINIALHPSLTLDELKWLTI